MSIIINGRGIISNYQSKEFDEFDEFDESDESDKSDDNPDAVKKFKPMSIEEYRKLEFTPEQEWNELYYPTRSSIEALNNIEIKKKGKGPVKNIYIDSASCILDGPYYDPLSIHLHIWKSYKVIKNFIGEQNQNVEHVQFTNFKPGTYCSICHKRNLSTGLIWDKRPNKHSSKRPSMSCENNIVPLLNLKELCSNLTEMNISKKFKTDAGVILSRWTNILSKALYILNNDKIVYPISKFKSLLLWPWEMTLYQKFKLGNINYRDSCIFIKSDILNFCEDYATIVY